MNGREKTVDGNKTGDLELGNSRIDETEEKTKKEIIEELEGQFKKTKETCIMMEYDILIWVVLKKVEEFNKDRKLSDQIDVSHIETQLPELERKVFLNHANYRFERVQKSDANDSFENLTLKQVFEKVQEFNKRSDNPIDVSEIENYLEKIEEK